MPFAPFYVADDGTSLGATLDTYAPFYGDKTDGSTIGAQMRKR